MRGAGTGDSGGPSTKNKGNKPVNPNEPGGPSLTVDAGEQGSGTDTSVPPGTPKNDENDRTTFLHKGGGTRGSASAACRLHVDNRTAWRVAVYVDRTYVGTVGPAGDLFIKPFSGQTSAYGRADFDDGSWVRWGPRTFSCGSSATETWRLTP